ncbi:hypothetical protein M2D07_002060 [Pseudomonas sp. BGr12]|uniref:hypothetical protein n=1 Tax=unclassified Pseudomonas TaxID=196821 RepID=UPI0009D963DC|nr:MULTISPECIES: hypothetical protein [unclassified Pseudomonas]MBD9513756.1 hypothetical protein [Pseudomonas sp. PDM22]MDL2425797.1 hypothetical protein [Pseudomonas sp. BJa5]OQR34787.1 hypothetical protein BWR15_12605 [Pseudomonas sp. T]
MLPVIAELLLTLACTIAAWLALREQMGWRALGFLSMGIAALLGALEYGGVVALSEAHHLASVVSGAIGLPLIALGRLSGGPGRQVMVLVIGVLLVFLAQLSLVSNLIALLVIAWPGRSRRYSLALLGALLFIGSGLLIGTRGELAGVPRRELFHLGLTVAVSVWILAGLGSGAPRLPGSWAVRHKSP